MTDALFELVPRYGFWVIFFGTFLSCLAVPIPTSFLMLAAGAFVASGDLTVYTVVGGAWFGALLGDQVGYWIARTGGSSVMSKASTAGALAKPLREAKALIERRGGMAVFFSRWLLSPLGPYVNLLAGAGGMRWSIFTLFGSLGEVVWVSIYISLGMIFSSQIAQVADIAGNAIGLVTSSTVTWILGRAIFKRMAILKNERSPA